jgi:hypothetical protein
VEAPFISLMLNKRASRGKERENYYDNGNDTKNFRPRNNGSNFSTDARLFIDVDIICELTINRRSLALCFYDQSERESASPIESLSYKTIKIS